MTTGTSQLDTTELEERVKRMYEGYGNLAKCVLDATQFFFGQFRPRGVVVGNANGRVEPVIHVRCRSTCAPLVPPPRSSPQTYSRAPGGQVLLSPGCSRLRRGGADARSGRAAAVLCHPLADRTSAIRAIRD